MPFLTTLIPTTAPGLKARTVAEFTSAGTFQFTPSNDGLYEIVLIGGGGGGGWDDSVEPLYVGQGHGWGAGAGYGPGGRNGYVRIKRIG